MMLKMQGFFLTLLIMIISLQVPKGLCSGEDLSAFEELPDTFFPVLVSYLGREDRDNFALTSKRCYCIDRMNTKNGFCFSSGTSQSVIDGALFYSLIYRLQLKGCAAIDSLRALKGQALASLDLSHTCVGAQDLRELPTSLIQLNLKGVKGSLPIGHLTRLTDLNLSQTQDDEILNNLNKFSRLSNLKASQTNIDIEHLHELLPRLSSLTLKRCILIQSFIAFQACKNLTVLNLEKTPFREKFLVFLPKTLRELDLSDCPHLLFGDQLSRFLHLYKLSIAGTYIQSHTFQPPQQLLELDISRCRFIHHLNFCRPMAKLVKLNAACTRITSESLSSLPPSLMELNISHNIAIVDHSDLRRLIHLINLNIRDNPIETLEDLPIGLEILDLSGCKQLHTLSDLAKFENLWWLNLSYLCRGISINQLPCNLQSCGLLGNISAIYDNEEAPCLYSLDLDLMETNLFVLRGLPHIIRAVFSIAHRDFDYSQLRDLCQHLEELTIYLEPSLDDILETIIIPNLPRNIRYLRVFENEGEGKYETITRQISQAISEHLPLLRNYVHKRKIPEVQIEIFNQEELLEDEFDDYSGESVEE